MSKQLTLLYIHQAIHSYQTVLLSQMYQLCIKKYNCFFAHNEYKNQDFVHLCVMSCYAPEFDLSNCEYFHFYHMNKHNTCMISDFCHIVDESCALWAITKRGVVTSYWHFMTTYLSLTQDWKAVLKSWYGIKTIRWVISHIKTTHWVISHKSTVLT